MAVTVSFTSPNVMAFPSARAFPALLALGISVAAGSSVGCIVASGVAAGVACGVSVGVAVGSGVEIGSVDTSGAITVSWIPAASVVCASVAVTNASLSPAPPLWLLNFHSGMQIRIARIIIPANTGIIHGLKRNTTSSSSSKSSSSRYSS